MRIDVANLTQYLIVYWKGEQKLQSAIPCMDYGYRAYGGHA